MGNAEVEAFMTHLAVEKTVSASTQNQALSALLFLHRILQGALVTTPSVIHSFATHLLEDGYDIRTVLGIPGSQRCQNYNDLHTCVKSRWTWGQESPRPLNNFHSVSFLT